MPILIAPTGLNFIKSVVITGVIQMLGASHQVSVAIKRHRATEGNPILCHDMGRAIDGINNPLPILEGNQRPTSITAIALVSCHR
jgi:hypothetical protein